MGSKLVPWSLMMWGPPALDSFFMEPHLHYQLRNHFKREGNLLQDTESTLLEILRTCPGSLVRASADFEFCQNFFQILVNLSWKCKYLFKIVLQRIYGEYFWSICKMRLRFYHYSRGGWAVVWLLPPYYEDHWKRVAFIKLHHVLYIICTCCSFPLYCYWLEFRSRSYLLELS
jgi:hypothetical protein